MNPEIQSFEHERRRAQISLRTPRAFRLPPLCIAPLWPRCREERDAQEPLRLPLAEIARRIGDEYRLEARSR